MDTTPEEIDPLLSKLRAEKERRFAQRVDAGGAVVVRATVVCRKADAGAELEKAKAADVKQHMASNPWDRDKAVIFDAMQAAREIGARVALQSASLRARRQGQCRAFRVHANHRATRALKRQLSRRGGARLVVRLRERIDCSL